jgi:hypothetical protein
MAYGEAYIPRETSTRSLLSPTESKKFQLTEAIKITSRRYGNLQLAPDKAKEVAQKMLDAGDMVTARDLYPWLTPDRIWALQSMLDEIKRINVPVDRREEHYDLVRATRESLQTNRYDVIAAQLPKYLWPVGYVSIDGKTERAENNRLRWANFFLDQYRAWNFDSDIIQGLQDYLEREYQEDQVRAREYQKLQRNGERWNYGAPAWYSRPKGIPRFTASQMDTIRDAYAVASEKLLVEDTDMDIRRKTPSIVSSHTLAGYLVEKMKWIDPEATGSRTSFDISDLQRSSIVGNPHSISVGRIMGISTGFTSEADFDEAERQKYTWVQYVHRKRTEGGYWNVLVSSKGLDSIKLIQDNLKNSYLIEGINSMLEEEWIIPIPVEDPTVMNFYNAVVKLQKNHPEFCDNGHANGFPNPIMLHALWYHVKTPESEV